jgi:hypothetical protein
VIVHRQQVCSTIRRHVTPFDCRAAFFVDGLGSSTVGSGKITVTSIASYFAEGKFVATNIYTPQITIVPNNAVPAARFVLDNVEYVLERN